MKRYAPDFAFNVDNGYDGMYETHGGKFVKFEDVLPLIEALKFYGDQKNYSTDYETSQNGFSRRCILYSDIQEINDSHGVAGKTARETLKAAGTYENDN